MFALVLMSQFSSLIVQTASIKVIYGYEVTSQTCDNLIQYFLILVCLKMSNKGYKSLGIVEH